MLCSGHFDPMRILVPKKKYKIYLTKLDKKLEIRLKRTDFAHTGYNNFQNIFFENFQISEACKLLYHFLKDINNLC